LINDSWNAHSCRSAGPIRVVKPFKEMQYSYSGAFIILSLIRYVTLDTFDRGDQPGCMFVCAKGRCRPDRLENFVAGTAAGIAGRECVNSRREVLREIPRALTKGVMPVEQCRHPFMRHGHRSIGSTISIYALK